MNSQLIGAGFEIFPIGLKEGREIPRWNPPHAFRHIDEFGLDAGRRDKDWTSLSRRRGKPACTPPIMSLRMPLALKAKVKDWAKGQDEKLSISRAICRLVEQALAAAESPAKPPRSRSKRKGEP
jgi:hypothetical protein